MTSADKHSVFDLLQCVACEGPLQRSGDLNVRCSRCARPVALVGDVLDFVAGAASTQLDDIDYDQFYAIDETHAAITYDDIRSATGTLWPPTFGDALEIGCGTGGFSMAVVANVEADRVLLTDVSLKMLAICQRRLARLPAITARSIDYATYSGQERCFRHEAFDTCFGTAVVHHVLDVPLFLTQVHDLLKPNGLAFFMEPNLRFHEALTSTLAQLIARWLREDTVPADDMSLMQNWMAEVHCNIVNTGDLDVLIDREDKHLFTSDGFVAMAQAAGFVRAEALACNPDPCGLRTIVNYLQQAGVSGSTLGRLRAEWPTYTADVFDRLAPRDTAPSYVFWLRKEHETSGTALREQPVKEDQAMTPVRLWLNASLRRHDINIALALEGWCLSETPVRSLEIEIGTLRKRVPIWRPRPDVEILVNTERLYDPLYALCSGIDAHLKIEAMEPTATGIAAFITVLAVDGARSERRQVMLELDGASQLIT